MKAYKVATTGKNLNSEIELPASKSISNRLLVMRALEKSKVLFNNLSEAEDTYMMRLYLSSINTCADSHIPMVIDAHNAGTVFRFLTAYLAQKEGKWLVTGSERMKLRPVEELVNSLRNLGADIEYIEKEGFPPLIIKGKKLSGGTVEMNASASSQYVSALMLIAPHLNNGLTIQLKGKPVSTSYIDMTAKLMSDFLIKTEQKDSTIHIPHGHYFIRKITVEPDWSSAAFWYQMVSMKKESVVFLPGLRENSVQGDRFLAEVFKSLGVNSEFSSQGVQLTHSGNIKTSIDYDFSNAPDIVPSVMSACAALGVKAKFSGIEHLRIKESDRIATMEEELGKLGATITKASNSYILEPGNKKVSEITFNSHGDHRIAMCLAPMALKYSTVIISDPDVVAKSYPYYWDDLKKSKIFNLQLIEE